jgi:aldehyde dehydrogenase (NAD+)
LVVNEEIGNKLRLVPPDSPISVTPTEELRRRSLASLERCGVEPAAKPETALLTRSPISGGDLFELATTTGPAVESAIAAAKVAAAAWQRIPVADRRALVGHLADLLVEHRDALAELIAIETGKVRGIALAEVQEAIETCGRADELVSRLKGSAVPSVRPGNRRTEAWHPIGVVAVVSARDRPVATWCQEVASALVCGNAVVWKPSPAACLTASACSALFDRAAAISGAPPHLHRLLVGGAEAGEVLLDSRDIGFVSTMGSGDGVAIVSSSADLESLTREVAGSVVSAPGRGLTIRRLLVHDSIATECVDRVATALASTRIGDPLAAGVQLGPVEGVDAYRGLLDAQARAVVEGGEIVGGGERRKVDGAADAYYVEPTVARMPAQTELVGREIGAPLLYVISFADLDQAIAIQDEPGPCASSVLFTRERHEAERFLAGTGPHRRVANVNVAASSGPSSDAWRHHVRQVRTEVELPDDLASA